MDGTFPFSQFRRLYPDDEICMDEIKRLRYPKGIHCKICNKVTPHYKLSNRPAYTCKRCRSQTYPLAGTIFHKTATPLNVWFYAMFLMTQTRGTISARKLQRELGVTYKTAWRMYRRIHMLMVQNNADLLREPVSVHKWTFFNTLEFTVVQRKESEE